MRDRAMGEWRRGVEWGVRGCWEQMQEVIQKEEGRPDVARWDNYSE